MFVCVLGLQFPVICEVGFLFRDDLFIRGQVSPLQFKCRKKFTSSHISFVSQLAASNAPLRSSTDRYTILPSFLQLTFHRENFVIFIEAANSGNGLDSTDLVTANNP
ncbi:hypothetical protein, unlikely [Trypanosoma brucei gambiense DAL972]|uniref:Uncharacterized protein n=1 Tax=Trypanosoma brucei gambiense (strain MHOM/CI/86/DAL972) TaxID=679716 RepID=C9ZMV3_TRYB9|nr:hypothetical protein, unlikely [Trypanosoma brucei gambiense DAL972]CBH10606.1 hypothetical protein, unlikely [Trypanosoma brucei gambiense DAL972]|eukprot:XP_011772895.1 hypothetical protein, unlikely [Trypanosoma brucei gambiense DAL972]